MRDNNMLNNKLIVSSFVNIYIGDGGDLFLEDIEVSEEMNENDSWKLIILFEIGEKVKYSEWKEGDNEEEWKGVFDYNGNVIEDDSEEMKYYIEEFNEKKVEFLNKRKNEKLMRSGVEYDDGMYFVKDDRYDEVVEILEKIKVKIDEREEREFGY